MFTVRSGMGSVVNFFAPNNGLDYQGGGAGSGASIGSLAAFSEDQNGLVAAFSGAVNAVSSTFFRPGEEFADIIADENDDSLSGGSLAGIIVGSVLAGILVLILIAVTISALAGAGGNQRFQGSAPTAAREGVDA
jgi:hypothetical protein